MKLGDLRFIAILLLMFQLIACGGAGEGTIDGSGFDIKGTAAVGAPIANTEIIIKDGDGRKYNTMTNTKGEFEKHIDGNSDLVILQIKADATTTLYSIGVSLQKAESGFNTVNITNLTDVVVRSWFVKEGRDIDAEFASDDAIENPPTAEEIDDIKGNVETLISSTYEKFSIDQDFDLIQTPFEANSENFDKLLDQLSVSVNANEVTIVFTNSDTNEQTTFADAISFDVIGETHPSSSQSPTAKAGDDFTVTAGDLVTLDGSSSAKGNSAISTYSWEQTAGFPTVQINHSDTSFPNATFSAPAVSEETTLTFKLKVTDLNGLFQEDSVIVTLIPTTTMVVADAGISQTVATGNLVTLNGSKSTSSNGSELVYSWVLTMKPVDSTAEIINNNSITPTFITDIEGNYQLTLTVMNGNGDQHDSVVTVTADNTNLNKPPVANAGTSQSFPVDKFGTVTLDGSNSFDGDSDTIHYSWFFLKKPSDSTAILTNSETMNPTFESDRAGTYQIGLIVSDDDSNSQLSIVEISTYLSTDENEPNNSADDAHVISVLGSNFPIKGAINVAEDIDWYRFEGNADQIYTIELFNVDTSLNAQGVGGCTSSTRTGMYIVAFNQTINEIERKCMPDGNGNVHTFIQVIPTESGTIYFRVGLNYKLSSAIGNYHIRVLPHHSDAQANWDSGSFEPNDQLINAYEIGVGLDSAITSKLEARSNSFVTRYMDVDYYRFQATKDQSYTIELFDVDNNLNAQGGGGCISSTRTGMYIVAYNQSINKIGSNCQPNGAGNVHTYLMVTASEAGTIYIRIGLNYRRADVTGKYRIRVLPHHSDTQASWNRESFEPNNQVINAYEVGVGAENSFTSELEARPSGHISRYVDLDYYRFQAVKDQSYVIELYDVDNNLNVQGSGGCISSTRSGMYIIAYNQSGNKIGSNCMPNGGGDVHTYLKVTASEAGTIYIRIGLNHRTANVSGKYRVRILPHYTDAKSTWSEESFEPNNLLINAYQMEVGADNAISSNLFARPAGVITRYMDTDYYRFEAEAGLPYAIELFNVDSSFYIAGGGGCSSNSYRGLYLVTYDSAENEISRQCQANSSGKVHVRLIITPVASGTVYIRVGLNFVTANVSGSYQLRVLPHHSNINAIWNESSFEPNNQLINAYQVEVGANNAITSKLDARPTAFITRSMDIDFYRFEAESGRPYILELFDVESSLHITGGGGCSSNSFRGMYLVAYNNGASEIARECRSDLTANPHTQLTITPAESGSIYVRVGLNNSTADVTGNYSFRVLPQ